jgi:hypothetical protein
LVPIDDPLFAVGDNCLLNESVEIAAWSGLDLLNWRQRRSA